MTDDARNARVVLALISSMTCGAILLMWLEPRRAYSQPQTLLMAESGPSVERVVVEFGSANAAPDVTGYDCVVFPEGKVVWQPREATVRLLVLAGEAERLPAVQAEALLSVLGAMTRHGLPLDQIVLHSESDARLNTTLPSAAVDLRAILVRKGILR